MVVEVRVFLNVNSTIVVVTLASRCVHHAIDITAFVALCVCDLTALFFSRVYFYYSAPCCYYLTALAFSRVLPLYYSVRCYYYLTAYFFATCVILLLSALLLLTISPPSPSRVYYLSITQCVVTTISQPTSSLHV